MLLRRDLDRRAGEFVALAAMRNLLPAQSFDDHFERLLENVARLEEVDVEMRELVRRDAAPDPNFEPSAAQLIEHANFLDQPHRMIERQQIHQRAEVDPARAHRHAR